MCVYTKSPLQIDPVMLLRSITQCHSSGSKEWWTISARRILWTCWHLLFSLSPFSLTVCSHTQWRPFLPGLKYEVIDSAYISLYTGKSNSSNSCHLVVESNHFMINFFVFIGIYTLHFVNRKSAENAQLRVCQKERLNHAIETTYLNQNVLLWVHCRCQFENAACIPCVRLKRSFRI